MAIVNPEVDAAVVARKAQLLAYQQELLQYDLTESVEDAADLAALTLPATFVRYMDTAGNPIASHTVTIVIDTATGDIDDIVYEGA